MTPIILAALAASASPGVTVTIEPARVCADDRANRNMNFDLDVVNRASTPVMITQIRASSRNRRGDLIEQRLLWQDALMTLGADRTVPAGAERLIFNPFTFDHPRSAAWIDYAMSFDDGATRTVRVVPTDCTTKANLRVPVRGRLLVHDGYDVLAHHRRERFQIQPDFRKFGVVDNPWRFAIDFIPITPAGKFFRGEGKTMEDWLGWSAPVLAPADGKVVALRGDMPDNALGKENYPRKRLSDDEMNTDGNYVLIDHGHGEMSSLSHLKAGSVLVKVGQQVRSGQMVARVGNSGATPVPHLHYELRTGFGIRNVRSMPAYFRGMTLVGTVTPRGPVALGTGDVLIAK